MYILFDIHESFLSTITEIFDVFDSTAFMLSDEHSWSLPEISKHPKNPEIVNNQQSEWIII